MKKTFGKHTMIQRLLAFALVFVMVVGYLPAVASADDTTNLSGISKEADPATLDRMGEIYGNNTLHAGKVTVDKTVTTTGALDLDGDGTADLNIDMDDPDNFLVTISQAAQVMALSSKTSVPVDVVFVLDTSGSMQGDRATKMVAAANTAIAQLMKANPDNRVGVVAFSSADGYYNGTWREYGLGTSGGNAANVLTPLGHYTDNTSTQSVEDDAATNHLRWVDEDGDRSNNSNNNVFIMGRSNGTDAAGYRRGNHSSGGGTNIQAGIALGAQMLTAVEPSDTYVTDANGNKITRIPFLIVLSDGAPTYGSTSTNWFNPSLESEHGDGSNYYTGNGFLAALTAAYYKGAITEHYFGANASDTNRCFVYTIGVEIQNTDLAELTLDPSGEYNANANQGHAGRFKTYWNDYVRGNNFGLDVNSGDDEEYTVQRSTITASWNYVNGLNSDGVRMYDVTAGNRVGGIEYNDGYYGATQTNQIAGIFNQIVAEISKKAISSPTQVTTTDEFDGYVTFTDVIGQYMEVKDMKGILADENLYQGRYASQNFGTNGSDAAFDATLLDVIATRMEMYAGSVTGAPTITAEELVAAAVQNNTYNGQKTQAYYTSDTDYDNSIVWWGKTYQSGHDTHVQALGHAVDDSVAYIEEMKTADATNPNAIPGEGDTEADVVVRSYFFYGTAGGTATNPNHEYMYFVVRVMRSLTAPYQQTVTISAPASLLSMEKVYITEDTTGATTTFTAEVEEAEPARVIYEVGLRSDINATNVGQIVPDSYKNDTTAEGVVTNYEDGAYKFYTNEWDRDAAADSHTRAMSKATFIAADNNPYYTYQKDTYLYEEVNGQYVLYTGDSPAGKTLYYYRDVYSWSGSPVDGKYSATMTPTPIKVSIPDDATITTDGALRKDSTGVYIAAGTYSAMVLSPDEEEEVEKDPNVTESSIAVAHPVRTGDSSDAHYTVYLGNNGVLYLEPKDTKTVDVTHVLSNATILGANGEPVMVGDTLTYTIQVINDKDEATTATVTDKIPEGTEFVAGSAKVGGSVVNITPNANGELVWTNVAVPADSVVEVSFQVKVTAAALVGTNNGTAIDNTAVVQLSNGFSYTTNTTENPPEGKTGTATNLTPDNQLKVGSLITYNISFANDARDSSGNLVEAQTLTITDIIPNGTTYVEGSATNGGQLSADGSSLVWNFTNVPAGASGVVSFTVRVDASAKVDPQAPTQPESGDIVISNNASIKVGDNEPKITNQVVNTGKVGHVSIAKQVTSAVAAHSTRDFQLVITESSRMLTGTYVLDSSVDTRDTTITFTNGLVTAVGGVANAPVLIRDDEVLVIRGLPQGVIISVTEDLKPTSDDLGWTDSYSASQVTVNGTTGSTTQADIVITNSYQALPAQFQLKGVKTFQGSFPTDITYTFTAQAYDKTAEKVIEGTGAVSVSATAKAGDADGNSQVHFSLSGRSFSSATAAPLYYLITENVTGSSVPGILNDETQYLLELQIQDPGNGQLVAVAKLYSREGASGTWTEVSGFDWTENEVSFVNAYPTDDSVTVSGTKTLIGRYIGLGEFTFEVVDKATGNTVTTVVLNGDSTSATEDYQFTLNYTAADMLDASGNTLTTKEFVYLVKEVDTGISGVTFDKNYYEVTVTVTSENGALDAQVTKVELFDYDAQASTLVAADALDFENRFTSNGTSVTLGATKNLSGGTLSAGDFAFSVYAATENWATVDYTKALVSNTNDANGNVAFAPMEYTPAMMAAGSEDKGTTYEKTFYYVIKETVPAAVAGTGFNPNIKYDTTEHKVKVVVSYTKANGQMSAKVYAQNGTELTASNGVIFAAAFKNTLNPDYINYYPVVHKDTAAPAGGTLPGGLSFSFTVIPVTREADTLTGSGEAATGTSAPTGENDGLDKPVTFTNLRFTDDHLGLAESRVFYFWIQESNAGSNNGVDYDESVYLLQITLSRNADTRALEVAPVYYKLNKGADGENLDKTSFANYTLVATGDAEASRTVSFENVYSAAAHINLTAAKKLTGRPLEAGEFDFLLQRLGVDNKVVAGSEVTGANADAAEGANGTVTFASLNFSTAMLDQATQLTEGSEEFYISYLMSELEPDQVPVPGVEYSDDKYIVTVKLVADTDNHNLTAVLHSVQAAVDSDNDGAYEFTIPETGTDFGQVTGDTANTGVVFVNEYQPTTEAKVTIVANKQLTGRPLAAGEFTFVLYRVEGTNEHRVVGVTNDADGNIRIDRTYNNTVLGTAGFDGNDEYVVTYHLVESPNQPAGVAPDPTAGNEYWIKVTIKHLADQASYQVTSVQYFADSSCAPETLVANVYDIPQDAAGAEAAMTAPFLLDAVQFHNIYTTEGTSYTPVANKLFLGGDNKILPIGEGQFSFEVVQLEKNPAGQYVIHKNADGTDHVVSTGDSQTDGTVFFSAIPYSGTGNQAYFYLIREVAGTDSTVTYDPSLFYLKVTVVDENLGTLKVSRVDYYTAADFSGTPYFTEDYVAGISQGSVVTFENHQGPGYVNVNLQLNKIVNVVDAQGRPYQNTVYELEGSEFDFHVYQYSQTAADNLGDYVTSGSNGASDSTGNALISFGSIPFTRADIYGATVTNQPASKTFQYVVVEEVPSNALQQGITIDSDPILVSITVHDDGYGNLTYDAPVYTKLNGTTVDDTFTNTYKPAAAELDLVATKVLEGKVLESNEFTFVLEGEGFATQTKGNTAATDENIVFDTLKFYRPGTYTFTVKEAAKNDPDGNYTMDQAVFTVIVEVTDDVEGKLHAVATYYKNYELNATNEPVGGIVFTNTYTPTPITENLSLDIDANKTVQDVTGNVLKIDLEGFWFAVEDSLGKNIFGEGVYGISDEDGNINFPSFTFNAAGEYRYWIREVENPAKHGYTEDLRVWELHIYVGYNNVTGKLYIAPEDVNTYLVSSSGQPQDNNGGIQSQASANPEFVNIYDPVAEDVNLTVTKALTGRDLKDHEFTFRLMNGSVIAAESQNHADGTVTFEMRYTVADMVDENGNTVDEKTFTYDVVEVVPAEAVDGKLNGVTYTTKVTTVTVVVKEEQGVLKAYVGGENDDVLDLGVTLENSYHAAPVSVEIKANKILQGADLTTDFIFELVDSTGKVLQTVNNAADGTVTFKLDYTEDDLANLDQQVFTYTIREKAGTRAGMIYDTTVYTATVTLTDDLNGHLRAEVVYNADPIFTNIYEGTSALAVIEAKKTVEGKDLEAGKYTFELEDADGNVITANNDAQGGVRFSMEYTEADTYIYTLREKTGDEAGMTYDRNSYTVTVEVTADQDGYLTATVKYGTTDGKAPTFVNSYTRPLPPAITIKLEGTKTLTGRDMKAGEFKFQVRDTAGNLVGIGNNNADGSISFTEITLPYAGTYVLTVTEEDLDEQYMTYDDSKIQVNVTVTEVDGQLVAQITYPEGGIAFENKYEVPVTPETGDTTPIGLYALLMMLSACAIVVLVLMGNRKKGKFQQ